MNMTAKERALKSVESTEDVPRLKQIVRLKNDGTSMSIDKAGTMDISKAPEALKSNTIVDLENPIVNKQT